MEIIVYELCLGICVCQMSCMSVCLCCVVYVISYIGRTFVLGFRLEYVCLGYVESGVLCGMFRVW